MIHTLAIEHQDLAKDPFAAVENERGVRYGLLKYDTVNLGDDVQSIAARQFLPRVDVLIDRDRLDSYESNIPTALIMNGWWAHRPEVFPPPACITPLFVSFHLTGNAAMIRRVTSGEGAEFIRRCAPIGCRDPHTAKILHNAGIEAYVSGCLTLTFPRYEGARSDRIVFVDVFDGEPLRPSPGAAWWDSMPASVQERVVFLTHRQDRRSDAYTRFLLAEQQLDVYRSSALVITSRLHAALPCVAFGTPVVFVRPHLLDGRLNGVIDILPIRNRSQVERGNWELDWDRPPLVMSDMTREREHLIQRTRQFISRCSEARS